MRVLAIALLGCAAAIAQGLPTWWTSLQRAPRFECEFVQESESAVFGKLRKEGRIQVARGGCLRASYTKGLLLVADGRILVQYDPQTKTAQRMDLAATMKDAPMLAILLDPVQLKKAYTEVPKGSGRILLEPKGKGLPSVELEGTGGAPTRATWTDPTGARQVLELKRLRFPAAFPGGTFTFQAPKGTRWIEPR
jgi:outer membrane lipoprotein-sorting protein